MIHRRLRSLLIVACALVAPLAVRAELPNDEGRAEVESQCTACHGVDLIERSSGYSRADWMALVRTMVDLSGASTQAARITGYLARHFPPNDRRTPTLVDGPVQIAFESWTVPTLGQRSRDPVEAPDGSIWWAGQMGNNIGRLDPDTGEMEEIDLPAGAYPHSVNAHPSGDIWYLGNRNGTVGVVDGETRELERVYEMPNAEARDPHTGEFDPRGRFWFTLQHSNMVGRIDPGSGQIDLITLDRPASRPYGIRIAADGSAWVACNGGPCLYHLAADDMAQSRVDLPGQESHVRRLDLDEQGSVWYVNSGAGRLGHYDPATETIREWPSPSGPDSHPYGLVVVDGIVWFNESGMRPDPLVRFDPATETFQSWPIPSSGFYAGILRHMRADSQGRLLIHQSSTNHILRVSVVGGSGGSSGGSSGESSGGGSARE